MILGTNKELKYQDRRSLNHLLIENNYLAT